MTKAAAEEARQVPAAAFVGTTDEDIQQMQQSDIVTADNITEKDCVAQKEDKPEEDGEEEGGGVRHEGVSTDKFKEINDLSGRMCHLLGQGVTINSEARCSFTTKALAGYKDQCHAHINSFQQRKITNRLPPSTSRW